MKKMFANVLVACTLMQGTAWAQTSAAPGVWVDEQPPVSETKPANRILGMIGVGAMIAGGAMMVRPKSEDWTLNSRSYCYSEHYREINFEPGMCYTTKPMIKAGLITAGAGALVTWLGYRNVKVAPNVSKGTVGATATVKW
jgi:hypothetical protein